MTSAVFRYGVRGAIHQHGAWISDELALTPELMLHRINHSVFGILAGLGLRLVIAAAALTVALALSAPSLAWRRVLCLGSRAGRHSRRLAA